MALTTIIFVAAGLVVSGVLVGLALRHFRRRPAGGRSVVAFDGRDDGGEDPGGGGGSPPHPRPQPSPTAPGVDWDAFDSARERWAEHGRRSTRT